jgi:precorrin-2 dehydrogenase/sirohydrochlorin ferrochelatase
MSYLVNLKIEGKRVLVVGGGTVALRKVQGLLAAGARVAVVAPMACDELGGLAEVGRVELTLRPYEPRDLRGAFVAVAATDDEAVNARVFEDAQAAGLLVNVADRPALCTFTLPAVVRRGALTLGVATDGRCPGLSREIRADLEGLFGEEYGRLVEVLADVRARLIAAGVPTGEVQKTLTRLYREGILEVIREGDESRLAAFIEARLPG